MPLLKVLTAVVAVVVDVAVAVAVAVVLVFTKTTVLQKPRTEEIGSAIDSATQNKNAFSASTSS